MKIIEIVALPNGAHRNQTTSGVINIPDGWAILPDSMETPNFPFGDITVDDQTPPVVTSWTPLPIPEPEPEIIPSSTEIISGTYIGTGSYGEANSNSIHPNIQAKVLMIFQNDKTLLTLSRTEATDKPFTWFASSAKEQCNENGIIYNWIAIS